MPNRELPAVTVRPAGPDDSDAFWRWRNDPATRRASFQVDEIPWGAHARWFTAKLADRAARLLVGLDEHGRPIGSIRFDIRGSAAEVSVVVAPEARGRGVGVALLRRAAEKLFADTAVHQIDALIRHDNPASRAAFESAGFQFVEDLTLDGVFAMRLSRIRETS